jgi:hypothetical protein
MIIVKSENTTVGGGGGREMPIELLRSGQLPRKQQEFFHWRS